MTASEIEAALGSKFTLQGVAELLAGGVCEAYAAYNNGNNLTPSLAGYSNLQPIYVYEFDPSGNPFSGLGSDADGGTEGQTRVSAAYNAPGGGEQNQCTGPQPLGTPSMGSQLFGFTATANDGSHNILVLRGTVTLQEAAADLLGWGDNVSCMLPSQSDSQNDYGPVNGKLFSFYADEGALGTADSLAQSCLAAIRTTMLTAPEGIPWFLGAHSLGGAMISLAALDATVSGAFGNALTVVFTFGSLHVGDATFAQNYTQAVPATVRVANLCDFVPSMVSIEPVTPTDPYVHVGIEATFVWQTWDDWGNHSLANIYIPMVTSHWDVIQWGSRTYPQ